MVIKVTSLLPITIKKHDKLLFIFPDVCTTINKTHINFISYNQVQQYPQLLARQTIRILHVLREYVLDNMDKSKCLILLVAFMYIIL